MKIRENYHLYASVTILFWSLAYVLTRLSLQYFSAFPLGFLRYGIAALTLLPVVLRRGMKPPRRADIPWFFASGGFGFFLYMILFNLGQASVTACTASVVIATAPVITALFARAFYREKLTGWQWAATGVEFIGVLILTLWNGALSLNGGTLWLLLAALCLSAYNLIQRRLLRGYGALQTTSYSIFAGAMLLLVFAPAAAGELAAAPPQQLFYVLVLGVFCSAAAYVSWTKAFSLAKQTSQVSNYMFVTPFVTTLLGFALANEVPDRATLLGGGVILLGVFLYNFGGRIAARLRGK